MDKGLYKSSLMRHYVLLWDLNNSKNPELFTEFSQSEHLDKNKMTRANIRWLSTEPMLQSPFAWIDRPHPVLWSTWVRELERVILPFVFLTSNLDQLLQTQPQTHPPLHQQLSIKSDWTPTTQDSTPNVHSFGFRWFENCLRNTIFTLAYFPNW